MAVRSHQLQTLDQLSGRPRILREVEEAGRERKVPDMLILLYLSCVQMEVCAKNLVQVETGGTVKKRNKMYFLFISES
jgi:hypothetical protein